MQVIKDVGGSVAAWQAVPAGRRKTMHRAIIFVRVIREAAGLWLWIPPFLLGPA